MADKMAPRIIYLDQWVWIQLAKAHYQRITDPTLDYVIAYIEQVTLSGQAVFPLGLGHYFETGKQHDAERRLRLASFMLRLSRGVTLLPLDAVIEHEIQSALHFLLPSSIPGPRELVLLGAGVAHTLGAAMTPRNAAVGGIFELAALAGGSDALGFIPGHRVRGSLAPDERFTLMLTALPDVLRRRAQAAREDFASLFAHVPPDLIPIEITEALHKPSELLQDIDIIQDIKKTLTKVLERHGLTFDDFVALGPAAWSDFVASMPSRRVDRHLLSQFARNPQLPRRQSDLNDFGCLGMAVAHCDVVVAKAQFTNLMKRAKFSTKATIIDDVRQLPGL